MHHRNLDEAYLLSLNAVQIEPTVITYRLNGANILMTNQRADNAVRVLETALSVAKTPQDIAQVQNALSMAKSFLRSQMEYEERRKAASNMSSANDGTAPVLRHATIEDADPGAPMPALVKRPFPPRGPRRLLEGTIRTVKCSTPAVMDLSVESVGHGFSLHSDNYYKVQFSALNFTPEGELKPCSQLEGMKARIAFVDVDGRTPAGQIVSVELSK